MCGTEPSVAVYLTRLTYDLGNEDACAVTLRHCVIASSGGTATVNIICALGALQEMNANLASSWQSSRCGISSTRRLAVRKKAPVVMHRQTRASPSVRGAEEGHFLFRHNGL